MNGMVHEEQTPLPDVPRKQRKAKLLQQNPFLEGKKWRNDEYGEALETGKHWRHATYALIAVLGLLGSIWGLREITRAPIRVFMAEVDLSTNTIRLLDPLPDLYSHKLEVVKAQIRTFVEILRRITEDTVMMGEDWSEEKGIFGRVTANGRELLNTYIAEQGDPLQKHEPVMVEVPRLLPRGKNTVDVSWIERRYSKKIGEEDKSPRELVETSRYSGLFSYVERAPRTEAEVYANVSGIWLDTWSYTKE